MLSESEPGRLHIGEWLIEPALDQISRAGETIKLEPRAMRLLMRLAQTPGQVVSAQQLLDDVWLGVVVGPASLYQAISQLRKFLGDLEAAPTYIANVPRKGYRLIASVTTVNGAPAHVPEAQPTLTEAAAEPIPSKRRFAPRTLRIAALALIAILVSVSVFLYPGSRTEGRGASVVVLPFVEMSGDESDAAFCDGLTEEISTTLAQLPEVTVIARTSAYAFRDKAMDVREIARQLSATHVLEGSMRRSGDVVRVTMRLVDARRGEGKWSESYDLPAREVFTLQQDIARSVASALELGLSQETSSRIMARGSANPEAYKLYLLGRHYYRERTAEGNARAIELNSQALALDKRFALAHVGLAQSRLGEFALAQRPIHDLAPDVERSIASALALDPGLSDAYATRGALRREQNRLDEAKQDLDHAIQLSPSNVTAIVNLGRVFGHKGLPREALEQFTRAERLDPLDFMRQVERCITLQDLGKYVEAAAACEEGRRLQPQTDWPLMASSWLALAQGQLAQALYWADNALRVSPRNVELYMLKMDILQSMHSFDEVKATFNRAVAVAGEDPRLQNRFAELLLRQQGADAARQFLTKVSLEEDASAAELLEAAVLSISVGDQRKATALITRATASPDFDSLRLRQYTDATWGYSYLLQLAAVDFRNGDEASGARRVEELLALVDTMERNGYVGWGLNALRADAYGLRGDAARAMEALQHATDQGWRDNWDAQRRPYLASLFERRDFQELMRNVEGLNASERQRYAAMGSEHQSG